jgi:hypothetical protein
MTNIEALKICIAADESQARRLAEQYRTEGELEHAAILQRSADDLRHVLHDLDRGFDVTPPEMVETCFGLVPVGGEG